MVTLTVLLNLAFSCKLCDLFLYRVRIYIFLLLFLVDMTINLYYSL